MELKYDKTIENTVQLQITKDNSATYRDLSAEENEDAIVIVQLENDAEADKMIAEFEDPTGDSMYDNNAIFTKYRELRKFRP